MRLFESRLAANIIARTHTELDLSNQAEVEEFFQQLKLYQVYVTALCWKAYMLINEAHFKLLRLLEVNPPNKQLELAAAAGVSLGKANYNLNAFLAKG